MTVPKSPSARAGLHLWLDDQRPAPNGWLRAHTVDEAIALITVHEVFAAADLDYWLDLNTPTGMDLLRWMHATNSWPQTLDLHTSDLDAWDQMRAYLRTYAPRLL